MLAGLFNVHVLSHILSVGSLVCLFPASFFNILDSIDVFVFYLGEIGINFLCLILYRIRVFITPSELTNQKNQTKWIFVGWFSSIFFADGLVWFQKANNLFFRFGSQA